MIDPAMLGSLQNTLGPSGLMSQLEVEGARRLEEVQKQAREAAGAAATAGTDYAGAAAAPPPQQDLLAQTLPQFAGNLADIISGGGDAGKRASQTIAQKQADLVKARMDNLEALKANWDLKAKAAEHAQNLEDTIKARMQVEKLSKALDGLHREQKLTDDNTDNQRKVDAATTAFGRQVALENLRSKNNINESAGGANGGTSDADAEVLADAIASRRADPNLGNRVTKESKAVRAALHRKYPQFNLATAVSDWNSKETFNKTENSQRFVALRASVQTVAEHLKDYEELTAQMQEAKKTTRFRGVNVGIMWAAKNGLLGQDAADAAAALYTNRGAVASELAVTLAGGYAPQKEQIKDAQHMVDTLWSPRQQGAAVETIKKLIKGRVKSAQRQMPFSGGKTNPYLQDITPVDVFGESYGGTPGVGVMPDSTSDFDAYKKKKGN